MSFWDILRNDYLDHFDTFGENFDFVTFKNDTFENDTFESVWIDRHPQSSEWWICQIILKYVHADLHYSTILIYNWQTNEHMLFCVIYSWSRQYKTHGFEESTNPRQSLKVVMCTMSDLGNFSLIIIIELYLSYKYLGGLKS